MSSGIGCTRSLDLALLWLCCKPAAAALIQPLTWELPYAMRAALNKQTNKQTTSPPQKKENKAEEETVICLVLQIFSLKRGYVLINPS